MLKFFLQAGDNYYYSESSRMPTGLVIFLIIFGIITIVSQWKVYQKAGQHGWASIIPIYNFIVLLKIVGKPWWWILLLLVPLVNLIILIWVYNLLSKSFGKSEGFTVGLVFLPIVFFPILAWGDAKYLGPQSKEALEIRQREQGFEFEQKKP